MKISQTRIGTGDEEKILTVYGNYHGCHADLLALVEESSARLSAVQQGITPESTYSALFFRVEEGFQSPEMVAYA
ncbi:hypothetical protein [Erwinia amylovora]|uniref:hypothetical protein n=1 Tax=Erwinia amylovora TaxID=552 RepID=UPI001443B0B1|nr:hypothetical protein [Erwinia amylovora]